MNRYKLSRQAEHDVAEIFKSTQERFGAYQARAYYAGLERTFGLLADFPRMGASADEFSMGWRRFRFQSHYIFYSSDDERVLIHTLIHVKMNLRGALFE